MLAGMEASMDGEALFSDQWATLYAVWGGGATPPQALHMVELILPAKAA
jgi:hypothetical protein